MNQEEKRRKKVLAQDEAYLTKMLHTKKLPAVVTETYERARMLADNAGMSGPLPVATLVALVTLVAQTEAEVPKKAAPKK